MPLLRRYDANSGSNVRPATGVADHRAANSEKEATLTKQANDFRGRIFSREDIFARGYFREKEGGEGRGGESPSFWRYFFLTFLLRDIRLPHNVNGEKTFCWRL